MRWLFLSNLLSSSPPRHVTPSRQWIVWRRQGSTIGQPTRKGVLWYLPTPKLGLFYLDDGRTLIVVNIVDARRLRELPWRTCHAAVTRLTRAKPSRLHCGPMTSTAGPSCGCGPPRPALVQPLVLPSPRNHRIRATGARCPSGVRLPGPATAVRSSGLGGNLRLGRRGRVIASSVNSTQVTAALALLEATDPSGACNELALRWLTGGRMDPAVVTVRAMQALARPAM